METINVFTEKFKNIIKSPLTSIQLETNEKDLKLDSKSTEWSSSNNKKSCSYCRVQFPDNQIQREHYKLDWHRYNLKQSLLTKPPISEEDFSTKIEKDDLSSISGSDSEKEETLDTIANSQGKIFLKNDKGAVVSLYKSLIMNKKEQISDKDIENRLWNYCCINKWTILMVGGGHFAGAVFVGSEVILHKTFHYYTVRAGQGGSQSSKDSKSGGSQPKSAGASLRRNNEQAFIQHVRTLLDSWKEHIERGLVIYRASGGYNQSILFGGNNSFLNKKDMRTIPFPTRRPTFKEIKRVHQLLSTATVYDSVEKATKTFSKEVSPEVESKRNKIRSSCINRAKSRETVERPLPTEHLTSESETEEETDELLSMLDVEISFDDLKEFDNSLTSEQRKKAIKKKKPKKSKNKKLKELEECRKKNLIELISNGNLDQLQILYKDHLKLVEESEIEKTAQEFINKIVDNDCNTLLHISAQKEQKDIMNFLLENNANPCLKNKDQLTAYTCTQSKEIREFLRQYARDNPEKHNYNKAQIPINALTNEEVAEKKKSMRKVKREKEKEKKKENEIKRKEDDDKKRFLSLSDREKRALAAERRIISQSGKITKRCFLCGADIAGKVPFEYMQNLFCTIDCLKAHRLQNPIVLS